MRVLLLFSLAIRSGCCARRPGYDNCISGCFVWRARCAWLLSAHAESAVFALRKGPEAIYRFGSFDFRGKAR